MSNLSELMRSRLAILQKPLSEHPDANLLTAFAAQTLPARARAAVLTHLERCSECRDVLALSIFEPMPEPNGTLTAVGTNAGYFWRWSAVPALAGLLIAAVSAPRWLSTTPTVNVEPAAPTHETAHLSKSLPAQPLAEVTPPPTEILRAPQPASRPKKIHPPARLPAKQSDDAPVAASLQQPEVEQPKLVPAPTLRPGMGFQSFDTGPTIAPAAQVPIQRFVNALVAQPTAGSVWRIEDNGTIAKSQDGKSWTPVNLNYRSQLYALSSEGVEIWAGGAGGNLFHSVDDGAHWQKVEVRDEGGGRMQETITKIGSTRLHSLELTTSEGSVWIRNGGSWRKR